MNKTTLFLFTSLMIICRISVSFPFDNNLKIKETNYSYGYISYEKKYYVIFKDKYFTKHVDEDSWSEQKITYNDYELNEYFGLSMQIQKYIITMYIIHHKHISKLFF